MKLLDRYLTAELVGPFVVGVAAFTAILMGTNMLFQLAKMAASGVPMLTVLRLFALSLPALVVLTFPMAMLFSSLMSFGRLSGESEMVAMFASGINLVRMLIPVFVLSLGVAVLTWEFNEVIVPWSSRSALQLRNRINQLPSQTGIILPQREAGRMVRLVLADEYDPRIGVLKNVYFFTYNGGVPTVYVTAPRAKFDLQRGKWEFDDATIQISSPEGLKTVKSRRTYYDIGKRPEEISKSAVKPEQMTYAELRSYILDRRSQGVPTSEDEVNLHRKVSLPFTSLVFAAIGAPLGIRPSRRSSGFGVGLGISVIIIFIFYVLTSYLSVLGSQGLLDPVTAAWLPNLITLALGIVLIVRAPK